MAVKHFFNQSESLSDLLAVMSYLFIYDLWDLQLADERRQRASSLAIPPAFMGRIHKGLIVTEGQAMGKGVCDNRYTVYHCPALMVTHRTVHLQKYTQ